MNDQDVVDSAAGPLGRRERKKLATRNRIVECAAGLCAEQGYDTTTMDDIAERADVARATVFNYFPRKEDILFEWLERRRAHFRRLVEEARHEEADTLTRLRRGLGDLARFYEDDPAEGRAMIRAWLGTGGPLLPNASITAELFAEIIRAGQEAGELSDDVDPELCGHVIFDSYMGALFRWVRDEERTRFADEVDAALELVLPGILGATSDRGPAGAGRRPRPRTSTTS